jgi:hypothetical protein
MYGNPKDMDMEYSFRMTYPAIAHPRIELSLKIWTEEKKDSKLN